MMTKNKNTNKRWKFNYRSMINKNDNDQSYIKKLCLRLY